MSAVTKQRALRRGLMAVGVMSITALCAPMSVRADIPLTPDMLPLNQVKPGMKGYGLTTFHGTTISRFDIQVVGVVDKANNGRSLIMIRILNGPMVKRGANLVQGMSGSPIYLKGKLIGALSQGEAQQKEPLNMVTPIADMLDCWDPNIPQKPTHFLPADPSDSPTEAKKVSARWQPDNSEHAVSLREPIQFGNRRVTKLVLNAPLNGKQRSQGDTAVLHRATTYLSVTGLREPLRTRFQQELDQLGYAVTVVSGPGAGSGTFKAPPLKPGSPMGAFLASGDIEVGGTGTVTYRRGNRLLAFGHPLMGLGAIEASFTSAYIVDIISRNDVSHHIALTGPTIGTLTQDRDYSISAELGRKPKMIPFEITVRDHSHRRNQTYRTQLMQHPELTPALLRVVAEQAITQSHNVPGDVMAKVTTTVDAAEVGVIRRTNIVYDGSAVATVATQDLREISNIVSGNPFYPLPVKSASMTVDITTGHNTATVERIFLKQGRYEPGDTLEVGVVLKPYRRPTTTRTLSLKIPSNTPTGRYQIVVRGGAPNIQRIGSFIISGGTQEPQTPPANVQQMVARLNAQSYNTDIVARLVLNSAAPALEGERLSQLPPNISALMRSERNSGVRLERDEIRITEPTQYVVSGTQQLTFTIVRKNTQEPAGGSSGGSSSPTLPGGLNLPTGGRLPTTAFSDDLSGSTPDKDNIEPGEELNSNAQSLTPLAYDAEARRWLDAVQNAGKSRPQEKKNENKDAKKEEPKKEEPKAQAPAPPKEPEKTAAAPQEAKPNPADEKPIGRQLKVWRQTARADFAAGDFHGASLSAAGELCLSPSLRRLASTSETYLWSLVSDGKGNLYAGTGTSGKILKIDAKGSTTVVASLPVVSVQSLLLSRDGNTLWAGSGVKGNLYRVAQDGTYALIRTLPEKYITALAEDSKGNIYIAPAGGGTVYRLKSSDIQAIGDKAKSKTVAPAPEAYVKTSADYVLALTTDAEDNLYIGTGNEGTLYRVTPEGKSTVLYSAKENAITALAVDPQGHIYAGTGPKGLLYHITPEGKATVLFDRAPSFYTALRAAPDGTFYACTVNAIYHIKPTPDAPTPAMVCPLDNPKEVDFLSLAVMPDGYVVAGTGNIGEVYTSQPAAQNGSGHKGVFESVVRDTALSSRWGTIRWNAMLPVGTSLRVETRTGNSSEPDGTWNPWSEVRRNSSDSSQGVVTSPAARFLQYRLTLTSEKADVEPTVREISIAYMPRNQAPKVVFQTPTGGERWSKSQTIKWNGTDPDNDTLTYELFYSNDQGATWKPFPTGDAAKPGDTKPGDAKPGDSKPANAEPSLPALELVKKQLDSTGLPEDQKLAYLESYKQRLAATNGSSAAASILRDASRTFETKNLPDGVYILKVVASDSIGNPTEALTAQAISEPFIIANSAPKVTISSKPVIAERSVAVEGSAQQNLTAVTAVQYRVDSGDWTAAIAKDGLFDSAREDFAIITGPLASGKHTIEVSVFNAAGIRTTEKIEVTIP